MPTFEISATEFVFDVYCSCGRGMCSRSKVEQLKKEKDRVIVSPCLSCLEKAWQKGKQAGILETTNLLK